MFAATVMCGHSAYDWNIIAVLRFSGGSARDVLAVDADRARLGPDEAGDRAQQRRLAAARAAEERDHLAALDVEAHAVEHARRAVGDAEVFDRRGRRHAGTR